MSTKKATIPRPIPLKSFLVKTGRSQIWLLDELNKRLDDAIKEPKISRVLNGRNPSPPDWVFPLIEIFPYEVPTVDEACRLLRIKNAEAK